MAESVDDKFYDRADAIIRLANGQCTDIGKGKVSASLRYAAARFNVWVSACGYQSGAEMESAKEETIAYFTKEFRAMLEENLEDYVNNFESYMKRGVQ